jgi:uncharacterized SAM-binding protein YcdF (DUF218 family)
VSLPILIAAFAVIAILACAAAALRTARRVTAPELPGPIAPADAIVVFGAAAHGGRPCPELRARLSHAARLYAQGWAPRVVCSGGRTGGASEALAMRNALVVHVPVDAIEIHEHGFSTRATIAAARRLGRVLLVSSPWHLHRIAREARRQGIAAHLSAAPRSPVARHSRAHRRQLAREVAATWWYALSAPWRAGRK